MLTKEDKDAVREALKKINVKEIDLDHPNPMAVKWFRFGVFSSLQIVGDIIKQMPESKKETE